MGNVYFMGTRFRLREVLDAHDPPMSQSELSRKTGLSLTTINALYLNKTGTVALRTLDTLSSALGCEPGDLIEREPDAGKRKKSA